MVRNRSGSICKVKTPSFEVILTSFSPRIYHQLDTFMNTMSQNAEKNIKEADVQTLILTLTNVIIGGDKSRIKALLPAIERRLFDLRSELTELNDICSFISYFGYANSQNDNLWNFFIKIIVRSVDAMTPEHLGDCICGLAHAQRGSNQLWTYLLSHFKSKIGDASLDTKVLVIKSLVYVGVEDSYMFDKVLTEEMTKENFEDSVRFCLFLTCLGSTGIHL